MKNSLWFSAGLLASSVVFADCAPEKLVRIVTQDATPGLDRESFAAKPKVMWRHGDRRLRLEEEFDPSMNVHLLIVADAPNIWNIDLVKKAGELIVDEDPTPLVHAPIFVHSEMPQDLMSLEYGCEDQFFTSKDAAHERTAGGKAMKHSLRSGEWKVSLATREDDGRPFAAILSRNDKVMNVIRYTGYQTLEAVPDGLFAPPAGIEITPAK